MSDGQEDGAGGAARDQTRALVEPVPRSPSLFVGRRAELARCAAATEGLRLVLVLGVAGVGKTSFMLRAAESLAARVGAGLVYQRCRPAEGIAAVAATAAAQLGARVSHHPDAIAVLLAAAGRAPLIVCLDDAHVGAGGNVLEAVAHLAALHRPLWFFAAAREALPVSPAVIDHLVVRLGTLAPDETRALWAALEQNYGPAAIAPEEVGRLSASTPWNIKQAFARPTGAVGDDPLGLRLLPPLEAEILAEACAHRAPIPAAVLLAGRPATAGALAVERLAARFFLERPTPDRVAAPDLVREAVGASPLAPGPAQHRRCLEYYRRLAQAPHADEALELQIVHHAVASGAHEVAEAILARFAPNLRRPIPVNAVVERELTRAIDALGESRPLSPPLQVLRARLRARQGEVARARQEVEALARAGEPLAVVALGEIAYFRNDPQEALRHLHRARGLRALDPLVRVWAAALTAECHRSSGAVDAAARVLRREQRTFSRLGPAGRAVSAWLGALVAHDCESYAVAARALTRARQALARCGEAVDLPLLESLARVVAAAGGAGTPCEAACADVFDETLFFRLAARAWRAEEIYYCGDVQQAAALAEETNALAARSGFESHRSAGACMWGEAARVLGHPARVVSALADVLRAAREAGQARDRVRLEAVIAAALLAQGQLAAARALALAGARRVRQAPGTAARLQAIAALAQAAGGGARTALAAVQRRGPAEGFEGLELELARTEILLWAGEVRRARHGAVAAEERAGRAGWRYLACRARLLAAEAAGRLGDLTDAVASWDDARAAAEAAGYAVEVARAALLGAALARMRGDDAAARAQLERALACGREAGLRLEEEAAAAGLAALAGETAATASPGGRLAGRLGLTEPVLVELRDEATTLRLSRGQLEHVDLARFAVVIDFVRARVKVGRRWVDLSRHLTLLEVLRPLARAPGARIPIAQLAREAWGLDYHPLRHQSRVAVAISRVRKALGDRLITMGPGGYGLVLPGTWAVVDERGAAGERSRGIISE
ncbi:MAG TPA: hypothetical protein VGQ83_39335 [Polyangia bacterium]